MKNTTTTTDRLGTFRVRFPDGRLRRFPTEASRESFLARTPSGAVKG